MAKTVIGVDPGLHGGISILFDNVVTLAIPMPLSNNELDLTGIVSVLEFTSPNPVAYVEKTSAWPGQGVSSMFKFGLVCGQIHGILAALGIPFILVAPQTWKKVILHDTDKSKEAAIQFCKRYFPSVSLLASDKSKKPHDGIAEALCIAEYGRRQQLGKL